MKNSQRFIFLLIVLFQLVLFSVISSAQTCIVPGDTQPCNNEVNITELIVYVNYWYQCFACVPDLSDAINAYFGVFEPPVTPVCEAIPGSCYYVDKQLDSGCLDGTYSFSERSCGSGADGNAYVTIQEAADSLEFGDTVIVLGNTEGNPALYEKVIAEHESTDGFACEATQTPERGITRISFPLGYTDFAHIGFHASMDISCDNPAYDGRYRIVDVEGNDNITTLGLPSRIYNSVTKKRYRCIESHTANADNKPGEGKDWEKHWVEDESLWGPGWVSAQNYNREVRYIDIDLEWTGEISVCDVVIRENERVIINSKGENISLVAYPRRSVLMGGFDVQHTDNVKIQGFTIHNKIISDAWNSHGIFISDADRCEVLDNHIYDLRYSKGIFVTCDEGAVVRDNNIERCSAGINAGLDGSLIENNTAYRLMSRWGYHDDDHMPYGRDVKHNGAYYACRKNHVSDSESEPGTGPLWEAYWYEIPDNYGGNDYYPEWEPDVGYIRQPPGFELITSGGVETTLLFEGITFMA